MDTALKIFPEKTAFVAIDLQKGIVAFGRELYPNKAAEVLKNAARLADAFRDVHSLVVLVNVGSKDGKDSLRVMTDQPVRMPVAMAPDWMTLAPEMKARDSDLLITKRQWGAFYGTELDLQLGRRGIDTIVLCGISTNIGVETTARDAYQRGYNQIFAVDAMAASSMEEHEHTLKAIFPRIGLVRTTEDILGAIDRGSSG